MIPSESVRRILGRIFLRYEYPDRRVALVILDSPNQWRQGRFHLSDQRIQCSALSVPVALPSQSRVSLLLHWSEVTMLTAFSVSLICQHHWDRENQKSLLF